MTNLQRIVLTFLLGALLGGAVAKPVQAAGDGVTRTFEELGGVVRALDKIAYELGEIRRNGGLKCHE